MIFQTKTPYEVPNNGITQREKRIELNIHISACIPYSDSDETFDYFNIQNSWLSQNQKNFYLSKKSLVLI